MIGFREVVPSKFKDEYEPFELIIANYRMSDFSVNNNSYKLIFVIDGVIELMTSKVSKKLNAGMAGILNPHSVYGLKVESENNLFMILELDRELFYDKETDKFYKFDFDYDVENLHYKQVVELLKKFLYTYVIETDVSIQILVNIVNDIINILKREFIIDYLNNNDWLRDNLVIITKKMFENLDEKYSLDMISKRLKTHSSLVSKVYPEIFGYGFSETYRFAQIKRALSLLLKTESNILEIALACGFSNSKPFYENFKKYIGYTPTFFRKQINCMLLENGKYSNLDSVLQSEPMYVILKEYRDKEFTACENSERAIAYSVDANKKGFAVENYASKIISKTMLGKRWQDSIYSVIRDIKFENMVFQVKFSGKEMYIKNENSVWEKSSESFLLKLLQSLFHVNFRPIVMFEIESYKNKTNSIKSYYKSTIETIKYYINFLRNIIPVSIFEKWRFEIDISNVFLEADNREEVYEFYADVYEYVATELTLSKIGLHIEEKDAVNFDFTNSIFKEIVRNNKLPEFFSFSVVDKCLYDKEIGVAFIKKRISSNFNKLQVFRERYFYEYSYYPDIYISNMCIYYDWNTVPKKYRESLNALISILGFMLSYETKIPVASVTYYDKRFDSEKEFYKNSLNYFSYYNYIDNYGIKNMNYFLNENLVKMGKECIHKSSGLIITRTFYDYQCLLYQDIVESVRYVNSDLKKTNSFPYRRYTIKISGLSGKYKIITRKFCNKDGTFYTEWKKMGSPKYITEEEKEYLDARIRPALEVEFVEIFNEFEKNINLDVFEMAFIEIKKLYL